MGNVILSECRSGLSDNVDRNQLPTVSDLTNSNRPHINRTDNAQQFITSHYSNHYKQRQQTTLLEFIPQRSIEIDLIYQSMIKEKPVSYSIQRKEYLEYFGVRDIRQLKQKLLGLKSSKKDLQMSKVSLSAAEVKRVTLEQALSSIKVIQYRLKSQSKLNFSSDKLAYRQRRMSKTGDSLQFEQIIPYIDSNLTQQIQVKNTPSLYNRQSYQLANKSFIFIGHVNAHNLPHGPGQLYHFQHHTQQNQPHSQNIQHLSIFIEAQFVNGSISSNDTLIINKKSDYFRGGFHQDAMYGKGKLSQADGLRLEGNFVHGYLQGKGKAVYPDGGVYQGYFHEGLRQGKGTQTWRSSNPNSTTNDPLKITYEGYFASDRMQGLGYLKTPNYEYWGPFISNMKEGKGTLKLNDGRKYDGWFEKDQICGYGQLHYPDGRVEKGIFPLNSQQ